jgi:hypothetical protein
MAGVADGIDFFFDLLSRKSSVKSSGVDNSGLKGASGMCYMAFAFMWLFVWHKVSHKDFSAIVTMAAVVQCLGFVVLSLKVRATRSVAGLSSKTLQMFVLYLCIRLCSTTLKKGYIPVDRSGQHFYQLMDMCTVGLAMHLLYCCHKSYPHSYQEEHDTLPLMPLVIPCVILACFVHADLNRNIFFDVIWFTSLNLETVALVPQLWMMSQIGGKVHGISAQFVACTIASKVMTVTFWMWAFTELVDRNGSNLAGKLIIGAYVVQLLLSADFMFYFAKGVLDGSDAVVLPRADGVEY